MIKTRPFLVRTVTMLAIASVGFAVSCSEDEPQFAKEAAYAAEESNIDAYYSDADDMAGIAVSESDETEGGKAPSGARELELNDDRFCGVTVQLDLDLSTLLKPIGDITIDFGNSCEDANGNIRRGKIKVHFEGRKFRPGSFISISFQDYQINNIKLNGVRTLTSLAGSTISMPKFQIELADGIVEWNGHVATREHCFVEVWDRGVLLAPGDDVLKINQCLDAAEAAEGINRHGVEYKVYIEKELQYKRGCPIAVSGIKRFVDVNSGKEIIIDYGSGSCDTSMEITVNGNIHNVHSGS